ncbi:MAG TPA: heparin lyase I family protein [Polyangia bacterium]|nr:heparin lyase I family protein [Polyangia bacterium]
MSWSLCSALPLASLLVVGPAHAAVVWTSTFEKGNLSEWMPGVNATKGTRKNVEVLGEQVHSGSYACKITVHPDDLFGQYVQDRVDIQHQSTLTAEGKDTWISGHYMMPADAGMRNEFAFWESNGSSQNVMDFWVEPKGMMGGGTTINFGVGFLGATKIWTADFTIGKWHQVAIHVHWSVNAQMGSVDVWYDGQQVVTAYKAKTKADGNTLFYQNGLHRRSPGNFVDTIYIDDFIEADALADVMIAAPTQPPGDGGATADAARDGGGDSGAVGPGDSGQPGTGGDTGAGAGSGGGGGAGGTGGSPGTGGASGGGNSGSGGRTGNGAAGVTGGCALAGDGQPLSPCAGLSALLGSAMLRSRAASSRRRRRR